MESQSDINFQTSLLNILEQLSTKKSDGCLVVQTGTKTGEIYFKAGEFMHAIVGNSTGEIALKNMLGWNDIKVEFRPAQETYSQSILRTSKFLLQDCQRRVNEWEAIKKVVTDFNNTYIISNEHVSQNINLLPDEWQIVSFMDGNRTVADIIEITIKDDFAVCQVIYKLLSSNLIKKIEFPSSIIVEQAFLDLLEKEFIRHLGPIATVIMNDAIEEFKLKRTRFPIFKVTPLIEKLSLEIENPNQRTEFLKKMIEFFHKI